LSEVLSEELSEQLANIAIANTNRIRFFISYFIKG